MPMGKGTYGSKKGRPKKKNLKTTGNYRLEFDVYEIDTGKVKELIDKLNKAFVMALVEYD